MNDFSIYLNQLTALAKKLGEYEYRFGIASEQMFGSGNEINSYNVKSPLKNTIAEWEECYKDFLIQKSQLESLNGRELDQNQSSNNSDHSSKRTSLIGDLLRDAGRSKKSRNVIYDPSEEDRQNLTEIRLPIELEQRYKLTFGNLPQGLQVGNIENPLLIKLEASVGSPVQQQQLLKFRNNELVTIPDSERYQGHDYPLSNVSYRLEADQKFWNLMVGRLESEVMRSGYSHLSIFVDETKTREWIVRYPKPSNQNNLIRLEIPIKAIKFEISKGIYWLEEAGTPIEVDWLVDPHGRFGCLGNKIYPITEPRANFYSSQFNSKGFYDLNTPEHERGEIALNNVKASLERLNGIKAWQSPHMSDADIKFKWDLFFEINNIVYPLQIKSSLRAAEEALSEYQKTRLPFMPLIIWVNPPESEDSARELVKDLALRFSKILDIPFRTNKENVEVFFLKEQENKTPRKGRFKAV